MNRERKGQSPFYPGQPVPVEMFVGRKEEISRIQRAAKQVAGGKPQAVFISGEYGIGKSSLARYVRVLCEEDPGLLGFHVMCGEADSLEELAVKIVQSIVKAPVAQPSLSQSIRNFFVEYIGEQSLFGIKLHLDKLQKDAPTISKGFLPFLQNFYKEVGEKDHKGLMLILDEINGLATKDAFARFLKNLVDENALSDNPLPLLLMLCGTEERRREIIKRHQPVERIFDVAIIEPMSEEEMKEFFEERFESVGMTIGTVAMKILTRYSGGFPKLIHLIGDNAFWMMPEKVMKKTDAVKAILVSAEDVGRKFVDQQVYKALRSKDYQRILTKLGKHQFDLAFKKSDIEKGLGQEEKKKFNNFLQRMKKLNVLTSGEERGEYIFQDRLTRLYIQMEAGKDKLK